MARVLTMRPSLDVAVPRAEEQLTAAQHLLLVGGWLTQRPRRAWAARHSRRGAIVNHGAPSWRQVYGMSNCGNLYSNKSRRLRGAVTTYSTSPVAWQVRRETAAIGHLVGCRVEHRTGVPAQISPTEALWKALPLRIAAPQNR